MGRTPVIASTIREFLPWNQILNYLEAVVRVYNRWGRRDNLYKARIKILVKAEGQRYIDEVEAEYRQIVDHDGAPHTIPQAELDRVAASFVPPALAARAQAATENRRNLRAAAKTPPSTSAGCKQNVRAAQEPGPARRHAVVQAPGPGAGRCRRPTSSTSPPTWPRRFSAGELRVTHDQNLLLPWVRCDRAARPVARRAPRRLRHAPTSAC